MSGALDGRLDGGLISVGGPQPGTVLERVTVA
jgi:hypothetical protein